MNDLGHYKELLEDPTTNIQLKHFNIICFDSMFCVSYISVPVKGILFKNNASDWTDSV